MRKIALLWCFVFAFINIQAQTIISGVVKNTKGDKISSASVTVEEIGKNAILAYAITNANGAYKLKINASAQQLNIKVKAFNHKPFTQKVTNKTQTLNFNLRPNITEIKEVVIKSRIITKKGDTISYNLGKFAAKNDRSLADALKRMPGIEVKKDGSILYQGEPINKFYVEGKDLMEGGYGLLSNSLPKDAVSKVQIMENHQPVKMLRDKVPSENAAINIKLKRKVTMTGRGEVGVGMSPFLWNIKLTPMFLSKKNQWLVNYKTNNIGEEVEREGRTIAFGNRWEGRRNVFNLNGWLSTETASLPNIPVNRYLMNNVHFLSANLLTSPFKNKEWELKANASYSNNAIERASYSATNYTTGVEISRDVQNHFYTNEAKTELIFTKNADKGFFKNTTSFNGAWNTDRADVNRQNLDGSKTHSDQSLYSPTVSFANSLSTIIPVESKMLSFQSYVKYQKDRQNLRVKPANYIYLPPNNDLTDLDFNDYDEVKQNFNLENLEINNSASVGFSYKKWTFTPKLGLEMNYKNMNSLASLLSEGLGEGDLTKFRNETVWNNIKSTTKLQVHYKSNNFMLFAGLPAYFYDIQYKDLLRNNTKELKRTTFEPRFFAQYEFASFFKLRAFGGINYRFGDINSVYGGYIINSPSTIIKKNSPMPERKNQSIGSSLAYRNPLNNLFFNIRYRFSNYTSNVISKFNPSNVNILDFIAQETTTKSQAQSAEIGKYFPKFKTNISLKGENMDGNSYFYNTDLRENKNNFKTLGFKFNNTYLSWLSVDYEFSHGWNVRASKNSLGQIEKVKSKTWEHDLSAYIYPSDNHTFGFVFNQRNSEFNNKTYSNPFFDVSYQYTWTKKKIDFELKWMNIANTKMYEQVSVSDQFTSITRMDIRPSQVMFTVKFNFK